MRESAYEAFLKPSIRLALSALACNFPSFPTSFPYRYSYHSFAKCRSYITELMCDARAASPTHH